MEKTYYTTIGLEIHAELNTASKMFCSCKNDPEETHPNVNICPVCTGQPGTLPVPNKKAIESLVKVGMALGGTIANFTEFDRKNYFYPDIPKGYQITQAEYPIVSGGSLAGVAITRVHLEEDTGTSRHESGGYSLVDFNRAGVPLMELVTEPVIHDVATIGLFAKELQLLLRYLGVSNANMEKGEMRVEVNISVSTDPQKLGVPVEIKNINSFRAAERAALYEQARMIELIEAGKSTEIVKETRGWDEARQQTVSQRKKETAADYRYFPDPDIPKLFLNELFDMEQLANEVAVALPDVKRNNYRRVYGLKSEDIEMYIADFALAAFFEKVASCLQNDLSRVQLASNYILSDLVGLMKKDTTRLYPNPEYFAEIIEMASLGTVSSRGAKELIGLLWTDARSPKSIAEEKGLIQNSDPEILRDLCAKIIEENPKIVADYRSGKAPLIMFLVGQVIKKSEGSANPLATRNMLEELLK